MKKKRGKLRRYITALLFAGLVFGGLLFMRPLKARADFGDFSGDSDYGGSDSGWDSGWSSDSDSNSTYYSSNGSSSSSGEGASTGETILTIIIIAAFVIYYFRKQPGKRKAARPKASGAAETAANTLKPMNSYLELDPEFNEAEFKEKLSNLYIQMQQCWHEKNIESLKPYFTDAFYNQCDRQLDMKRKQNQTSYTERIAVLEVVARGYYQESGMDHIVVRLKARIVDYTLDDNTGKVVSGDRNAEKFMTYEWDLCRKSGVITAKRDEMRTVTCPSCGAPVSINQSAKCPYCGTVITVDNEDWALNGIKGISQETR